MKFNAMFNKPSLAAKAKQTQQYTHTLVTNEALSNTTKMPTMPIKINKNYVLITTEEQLLTYLSKCEETGLCAFDWETSASDEEFARHNKILSKLNAKKELCNNNIIIYADNKAKLNIAKKQLTVIEDEITEELEYHLSAAIDPHRAKICTASISAKPHEAIVVCLDHKHGTKGFMPHLSRQEAIAIFFKHFEQKMLMNENILKIAFNLAFETKMALKYNVYINAPVSDPHIMIIRTLQIIKPDEIVNPKMPSAGKGLKQMAKQCLGVVMLEFTDVTKNVKFFDELSTDDENLVNYSAQDADYALQLHLYWKNIAEQIEIKRTLLHEVDLLDEHGNVTENKNIYDKPYGNYYEWLLNIEMSFTRVIGQMEFHGFTWNAEKAEEVRKNAETAINLAVNRIKSMGMRLFEQFSINACETDLEILRPLLSIEPGKTGKTESVRYMLFNILGCPTPELSEKTGKPSMDHNSILDMRFMVENNLIDLDDEKFVDLKLPDDMNAWTYAHRKSYELRNNNPYKYKQEILQLLEYIEEVQKYGTILSSHIDGRIKYVHPFTGRIHAGFSQWTETGRLNSFHPNNQNVPRPDTDKFGVRNVYRAAENKVLILCDYSMFELRLIAWAANDKNMQEIFNNGGDLHRATAATMTNKKPEDVTKEERTSAKSGNFGIGYCGSAHTLQRTYKKLGMRRSLAFCDDVINAVTNSYPRILPWQKECAADARESGYADTIFGYRRMLPFINSANNGLRMGDERKAANTPIQGSAADIVKRAQIAIFNKIAEDTQRKKYLNDTNTLLFSSDRVNQIQQFHDEIVIECDKDADLIKHVITTIRKIMEEKPTPNFPVKLVADAAIAKCEWGKKKEYNEIAGELNEYLYN